MGQEVEAENAKRSTTNLGFKTSARTKGHKLDSPSPSPPLSKSGSDSWISGFMTMSTV
jgi:hypothetical protein